MDQLEQRISRLEKNLRNYRIIFVAMTTVIISVVLMSSGNKNNVPELLQAKAFQVIGDNGNAIAELGKDKGNGSLTTYFSSGKKLVNLFTSEGGSGGINTFDADGDVLFKVTRTSGGGGYLALFNGDAKEIAELGVTVSQGGYMRMNDKYGDKLAWITNTTDGGGYFALLNNNVETIRFSTPDIGVRIGISNKRNKRVAYLGTQENQEGNLTIYNSNEEIVGSIPK